MNRALHAVIMPGGNVQLEWSPVEERVPKSRQLLEQEIFRRFGVDKDSAFLFLGFSDKSVLLSDSINFWRAFAGLFAEKIKIRMMPDREQLKENFTVSLSPGEARSVFDSAPLMTGAEYLNAGLLENIWVGLNRCFAEGVRHYKGTSILSATPITITASAGDGATSDTVRSLIYRSILERHVPLSRDHSQVLIQWSSA